MRLSRKWFLGFAGSLLAVIPAAGIGMQALPLKVAPATPAPGTPVEVYGLGTVEARIVSRVGFEVTGTLVDLSADHGDRMAAGAVLARLDTAAQEARVAKAQAAVQQAEAALQQASAKVGRANALVGQKDSVNRRRQTLARNGTVSAEAAEDAQSASQVAVADAEIARGDLAVARAALADAQASLTVERETLAKHVLTAPFDALVTARQKELGSQVAPGTAVFTLIDPSTVWVLAFVDEAMAGGLAVGQPAEIRLRSRPGSAFAGRVARIDVESDRVSEERRVYMAFDAIPDGYALGEQAEVTITVGILDDRPLVPLAAVTGDSGGAGTVWTVEDGRLARRKVRLGRRLLDGRVEIAGGLPEGARPVAAVAPEFKEGRRARFSGDSS